MLQRLFSGCEGGGLHMDAVLILELGHMLPNSSKHQWKQCV